MKRQGSQPIKIEHSTSRTLSGTYRNGRGGCYLSEVLEWITDLQANGVPEDAVLRVLDNEATAMWGDPE